MKEIRCPYCRSLYTLDGSLNFSAPKIQIINCPVCKYPQNIATDFPLPVSWGNPKVVERNEPLMPWNEFKLTNVAAQNLSKPLSPELTEPLYNLQAPDWLKNIASGISGIGIWVIAVLVLIFLIKRK